MSGLASPELRLRPCFLGENQLRDRNVIIVSTVFFVVFNGDGNHRNRQPHSYLGCWESVLGHRHTSIFTRAFCLVLSETTCTSVLHVSHASKTEWLCERAMSIHIIVFGLHKIHIVHKCATKTRNEFLLFLSPSVYLMQSHLPFNYCQ